MHINYREEYRPKKKKNYREEIYNFFTFCISGVILLTFEAIQGFKLMPSMQKLKGNGPERLTASSTNSST